MAAAPASPLTPEVYEHLRAIAARIYRDHGQGDLTLQPTALVHEAWIKLRGHPGFDSRVHFLRSAAHALRQVLVDHERAGARTSAGAGSRARPCRGCLTTPRVTT